jgi:hypothetical protein
MRRVTGLVLLLAMVGIMIVAASCRKDIVLVEPDTIRGEYIGEISYKVGTQREEKQFITWRFTDIAFNMWYDEERDIEENGEGASRKFCDVQGDYTLGSGVDIDTSWTTSLEICDETRNPSGTFALDRSTDTLRMTQYDSEADALLTIKLLKE